jgi:competence protein ComEC
MRLFAQSPVNSNPLALLAAAFAFGIFVARFASVPLVACLVAGALCTALSIYCQARLRASLATFFIALAFCCAGAAFWLETTAVNARRVQRLADEGITESGDPVEATGVLMNAPEVAPDGLYLTLRVEKLSLREREREAQGIVWLFVPVRDPAARMEYDALELRYGARVRVMTTLSRAERFRNPGVSSLTEYLEGRGYDATGVIKSPLLVERLDDERVFLPLAWLYEWRQSLLSALAHQFSPETSGVLQAALLGNRYYLSHDSAERFREAGTFHVLVISGLHISFIGGLALFVMRRLSRRRGWQFIVSALLLWAYAVGVGAESSVVRAALTFTVIALAPVVSRRARALNALGCAALMLLVWRPNDLFDASFQLTFLSVLLIILVAWPLLSRLRDVGRWRPCQETPYPPRCPRWWRLMAEALFWSEREWQRELARAPYSCRLFKTPWAARLERWRAQRPLRYAVSALVVSTSVQLGLLPVLILYFHRLSLSSFILNIFVGILMALLSLVALLALLIAQLSAQLAAPFLWLAEQLNWLMTHSVDPFNAVGLSALRLPEYTGWRALLYLLYYAPLLVLCVALARWNPLGSVSTNAQDEAPIRRRLIPRLAAFTLTAMLILILTHPSSASDGAGRLRIDFLDVGQGDAALLTMPDGTTLLVDGGGRQQFNTRGASPAEDEGDDEFLERDARGIGEAVVSEYLWWSGLDHVDYLLATHADADHIDGLCDVARNFRVRAVLVARAPADDPEFARFAAIAARNGVPLHLLAQGDRLHFGAIEADVLWPARSDDPAAPSGNNDSLVLSLRFGDRRFLLTGDIEKEAEAVLVSMPEELKADVVKVAHHGSRTSSTAPFVALAHPLIAVISVGRSSIFGHPHREVVERWRAGGAEVLTTGQRGTITISTDGKDLRVETFVPE